MDSSLPQTPLAGVEPTVRVTVGPGEAAPELSAARRLEARLVRLENYLGFGPLGDAAAEAILAGGATPASPLQTPVTTGVDDLEKEIGEYWLARVGVLALCLGLAFLVAFPLRGLPAVLSSVIGFVAAGAMGAAARRWHRAWPETAGILMGGACFLLFFAVLRLHFFSPQPAVASRDMVLSLLAMVVAGELLLALRWGSQVLTGFVVILGLVAGAVADVPPIQFGALVGLSSFILMVVWRRNWPWLGLVVTGMILAAHLDWLLGHPLLGRAVRGVSAPAGNLFALAGCVIPLAVIGCRPGAQSDHVALRVGRALVLAGGVLLIVLINGALFPRVTTGWVQLAAGVGLLGLAVAYWWRQQSIYATAIFTSVGNLLVSVAIIREVPAPGCYAWLAWQSLLVAGIAVTFRSRIIVVANLFIYAGIYAGYVALTAGSGVVNLSFALVALLTARLLNWRKDTLDLRTGLMRNLYLAAAGIAIPYGLYQLVPRAWVGASWLAAAGGYFVASALLRNAKYRWMGILTVLATIAYVFIVDLARLEPAYRIVSFLILGIVLLGISLAYSRYRRRGEPHSPAPGVPGPL